MSPHNHHGNSPIVVHDSNIESSTEHVIRYQNLYRASATADRAYEKYLARGREPGHDVEDWLASEREIDAEQRDKE